MWSKASAFEQARGCSRLCLGGGAKGCCCCCCCCSSRDCSRENYPRNDTEIQFKFALKSRTPKPLMLRLMYRHSALIW